MSKKKRSTGDYTLGGVVVAVMLILFIFIMIYAAIESDYKGNFCRSAGYKDFETSYSTQDYCYSINNITLTAHKRFFECAHKDCFFISEEQPFERKIISGG